MSYRALIFDDQKEIRQDLSSLFGSRGYKVFTFPHPALCPLSDENRCPCPAGQACSDVIISDVQMPFKNGLAFIEEQINKGCRCNNIALMSGSFTSADLNKARSLGIRVFEKPFKLAEITDWLNQIEKGFDPGRKLADWLFKSVTDQNSG